MSVLCGVRVLDFGRYVAAPYCAMVLADLGAEVIRIERPGGELDRRIGLLAPNGEGYMFTAVARGKKAVTLALSAGESAREPLARLVAAGDVVLHNFSPAAASAVGLDYAAIRRLRPDVIYAAVTGFGDAGPDAERPGFDPVFQFRSGAAAVTGLPDGGPVRAGVAWVDFSTGLATATAVLAALRHRDQTGEGQAVSTALLQTAVSLTASIVAEATVGDRDRPRLGNQPAYVGPANLYPCRDGDVYLAAISGAHWRALCQLVGRPELGSDAELAGPGARYERRRELDALVAAWTRDRTVAQALAALGDRHIPSGPCLAPRQVADDPQVRANGMLPLVDLEHPGCEQVPVSATPFRGGALTATPVRRPPRVGEHNREIYAGLLGYSETELRGLAAAGVI
jgi:crotonobetainyl-CoA:carnitine CoA-transferase CaiB-like acyl-CoA transferase